jgi:hypothetical protein
MGMEFHCSRCHAKITGAEGATPGHCPKCKAEAGLEPVKRAPVPMLLFAAFLGTAVVAVVVGGVMSMVSS